VGSTSRAYSDNGGMSCTSALTVDPKGMTRFFLDQGDRGAMFKEPLDNFQRNFDFRQNSKREPYVLAVGDWGLTNRNGEDAECRLTMDGCANGGFFGAAKGVYQANQGPGGTTRRPHINFLTALLTVPPQDFNRVTEFQMSFRGEESLFAEQVEVNEGEREWLTTPYLLSRRLAYQNRNAKFLGL
jgi:hypothetical protein